MIWMVLVCILVALFLVSLIRVGVRAEYDQRLTVRLRVGLVSLRVYPLRRKKAKKEKKVSTRPKRQKKRQSSPRAASPVRRISPARRPAEKTGELFRKT